MLLSNDFNVNNTCTAYILSPKQVKILYHLHWIIGIIWSQKKFNQFFIHVFFDEDIFQGSVLLVMHIFVLYNTMEIVLCCYGSWCYGHNTIFIAIIMHLHPKWTKIYVSTHTKFLLYIGIRFISQAWQCQGANYYRFAFCMSFIAPVANSPRWFNC